MKSVSEPLIIRGQSFKLYLSSRTKGEKVYESHTLTYTARGTRQRRTFATREKALAAAKVIADQLAEGTAHVHALTPGQLADYHSAERALRAHSGVSLASAVHQWSEAQKLLAGRGTLADAVSMFVKNCEQSKLPEISTNDLVTRFCDFKRREGVSSYYINDLERKLTRFAKSFQCGIASIRSEDISDWITHQGGAGRNANNLRNGVVTLFAFARSKGFLARDKKTEAEIVDRLKEKVSAIGIYQPDELAQILAVTPDDMIPSVALAAFTGLRSAELFRLDWKEVCLDRGHIVVAAEKAKTAQRRLVPVLPALTEWLTPHVKKAGRVTPDYSNLDNFTRRFAVICDAANVTPQRNGFRHSFASYRLAIVQSADQVALEMGNSPRKLFTNYRELCTAADAEKWFATLPCKPGNVIPMRQKKAA